MKNLAAKMTALAEEMEVIAGELIMTDDAPANFQGFELMAAAEMLRDWARMGMEKSLRYSALDTE